MNKILTVLNSLYGGKLLKSLVALGIIFMVIGCTYINQVTMGPKVEKLAIPKPIPLEAGLLITEESKTQIFMSANTPHFSNEIPTYYIEPYQLPIGEAFEKASVQVFSQVFQKVHLVRSLDEAKNYPLVIEPKLENFDFQLTYIYHGEKRPYYALVEFRGKAKVVGTLFNRGRKIWQKTSEPPVEPRSQVYSNLLIRTTGEEASETIVRALKGLAFKMVEESTVAPPPPPVRGWLEEVNNKNR
jgi:hypothetical protein